MSRPVRLSVLAVRALRAGCPHCGGRRVFTRWFRMAPRCPTCGLKFERVHGHWVGAVGMNTILTFGVMALALTVGFVVTYPVIPTWPLFLLGAGIAVFGPILFWPVSHMIWTAMDIAFRPVTPDELVPDVPSQSDTPNEATSM